MEHAILDTSFILTAVRNRIDLIEELQFMGLKIVIPKQVIEEIKKVAKSEKRLHFREDAELALKLLSVYPYQEVDIGKGHVDNQIIEYAKKNKHVFVGTIDEGLGSKLTNRKIIIRNKKQLEVIS